MHAGIGRLGAIIVFLAGFAANAAEDARQARFLLLPSGFTAGGISPDGSSVLGHDAGLGGAAMWRRGEVRPLERDPANRIFDTPRASSRRARLAVGSGLASGANVWWRGHRLVLAADGEAADVSASGHVIVGLVRDPDAGEVGMRWLRGKALVIRGQSGFEAFSGRAVSASGRTIVGIGAFDGGPPTRFLWRGGRAIEIDGHPDAIRGVNELPFGIQNMQLSSDGLTAAHADIVDEVTTCHRNVCRRDIDFQGWRWRGGVRELLDETQQIESFPSGITANGEVIVGSATSAEGFGPFLWDSTHGMRRLTGLLESLGADLQGLTLAGVSGISDDGRRIVGPALGPGGPRALLLSYLAVLPPACSDRVDNDGDGRVDFPEDRGCRSRSDAAESRGRRPPRERR